MYLCFIARLLLLGYSARKLILILPSHGGWKAESTCRDCRKSADVCTIAVAVVINTTAGGLSHRSQGRYCATCRERHMRVNNLPEVVSRQRGGRELNRRVASPTR